MKTRSILLSLMIGAIAVPLTATPPGCGIARADEIQMPRNQAEFDQFAARLDNLNPAERNAQLNRAGNAFDNGESRLFWFTDLEAARAQAKREGKPILSLRLLGNLSDELSCANSRLFRVLLYPNAAINRQLRENFVLHWSSERPVPVATIDMGDGRVFKRTLTGNSAHYLLDANGEPLDVLPGLYAPDEFAAWLQRGADFAREHGAMNVELRPQMLSDWHKGRLVDIALSTAGFGSTPQRAETEAARTIKLNPLMTEPAPQRVSARDASILTEAKRVVEMPILGALPEPSIFNIGALRLSPEAQFGARLNFAQPLTSVSLNSVRAIPELDAATRARITTMQPENDAQLLIQTLEQSMARDTRSNRLKFEPAIHAYFVNEAAPDFGKLNRAIYDKLFRTPASDPWLGLVPADAFVALRNGGVQNAAQSQQRTTQNP